MRKTTKIAIGASLVAVFALISCEMRTVSQGPEIRLADAIQTEEIFEPVKAEIGGDNPGWVSDEEVRSHLPSRITVRATIQEKGALYKIRLETPVEEFANWGNMMRVAELYQVKNPELGYENENLEKVPLGDEALYNIWTPTLAAHHVYYVFFYLENWWGDRAGDAWINVAQIRVLMQRVRIDLRGNVVP